MSSSVGSSSASSGEAATASALFPPSYRLVFYCFLLGVLGAAAALAFEEAVRLAQSLFLDGLGRYRAPEPGSLPPAAYSHAWRLHWWIPLATTLGGALSGLRWRAAAARPCRPRGDDGRTPMSIERLSFLKSAQP